MLYLLPLNLPPSAERSVSPGFSSVRCRSSPAPSRVPSSGAALIQPRICQHTTDALIRPSAPLVVVAEARTPPQASEATPGAPSLGTCPSFQVKLVQFVVHGSNLRVGNPRNHPGSWVAWRAAGQRVRFGGGAGVRLQSWDDKAGR